MLVADKPAAGLLAPYLKRPTPTPAPSRPEQIPSSLGADRVQLRGQDGSKQFPPGFIWGAATAAHQVEGGLTNNWTRFEQIPGKIENGDKSGDAVRHWDFFKQDLELARQMNHTAYRFSIEWSRVEPKPGVYDEAAIAKYREILATCKEKGLKPIVTLHHFTNPLWVEDQGGWTNAKTVADFERFARKVVGEFKGEVDTWVTFNEPVNYAGGGYMTGHSPPGLKDDAKSYVKVLSNMLHAHARTYAMIHQVDTQAAAPGGPAAEVGLAHQVVSFIPMREWNPADHLAAGMAHETYNHAIMEALKTGTLKLRVPFKMMTDIPIPGLKGSLDYWGINYYTRNQVDIFNLTGLNYKSADTDMGWEIYPQGISEHLKEIYKRYGKPIYILENGIADATRAKQESFIVKHLDQVHQAMEAGVPVKGMLYWSLLDNFEWNKGFFPRFGLIGIDYTSPEKTRSMTPGGQVFGQIAGANAIPKELLAKHAK